MARSQEKSDKRYTHSRFYIHSVLCSFRVMATKRDRVLGDQVRKLRRQSKITQNQLAERTGLSTKYIQFIEAGNRKPSLKTVYKIAKALGVEVKGLFPF